MVIEHVDIVQKTDMIKVYYLEVNSGLNKTKARMLNMNAWMLNIVDFGTGKL